MYVQDYFYLVKFFSVNKIKLRNKTFVDVDSKSD